MTTQDIIFAAALVIGCALLSATLILAGRPLLQRYALARPNHRTMHTTPTAQGGGIAVLISVIAGCSVAVALGAAAGVDASKLALILAAAIGLAVIGALDDLRNLPVAPRLLAQAAAGAVAILALPEGWRVLPEAVPLIVERALLLIAVMWFVNLTNFMDGLDWMTVAEVVPVTTAIGLFWLSGHVSAQAGMVAFALLGATLGFAPFNKPLARLFLGDVGSLPMGLLLAWLLMLVAQVSLAAAILLPLYYLMDATVTLLRRLLNGETVTQAHRSHFYQRAVSGGANVSWVILVVLLNNIALAILAALCLVAPWWLQGMLLAAGVIATATMLMGFVKGRS